MYQQKFHVVKKSYDHLNFMASTTSYSTESVKMNTMLISEFSSLSNSKSVRDLSMSLKSCTGTYVHFY